MFFWPNPSGREMQDSGPVLDHQVFAVALRSSSAEFGLVIQPRKHRLVKMTVRGR